MDIEINETTCCGMREIANLSDFSNTAKAMQSFCDRIDVYNPSFVLVVFTGVVLSHSKRPETYGQKFAKYIKDNSLGHVVGSKSGVNPNSSNTIKAWIWMPHFNNLQKWHNEHRS